MPLLQRSLVSLTAALVVVLGVTSFATTVCAQMDVIVLSSGAVAKNGSSGDITAYSLASTSCNQGAQVASWIVDSNEHPVIAGNIYRLDNGLLEQIGMSWLKHSFCAVNEPGCGSCQGTPCETLGVQCADTYGTGLNGAQAGLGPRSDVNATTGEFNYPFPTQGQTGDVIFKRCQVHTSDLDPQLHPNALYFGVVQYVTTDEPAFGTQFNNASYRQLLVGGFDGNGFPLNYSGNTATESDPIAAWQAHATGVERAEIFTSEANLDGISGQVVVGTRVENAAPNLYRYQYVIYNNNSDRSIQSLTLPLPPGIVIDNLHFHDVDYHSGEPYADTDWQSDFDALGGTLSWSCQSFDSNEFANALRWGTSYSFSFETNAPPTTGIGVLSYFKPGTPNSESFPTRVPSGDFTLGVTQLSCGVSAGAVGLSWTNEASYDLLRIARDGTLIAELPGNTNSFTDVAPPVGVHDYTVTAVASGLLSADSLCTVDVPVPLTFDFPEGLPEFFADTGASIAVNITPSPGTTLDTDSPTLIYDLGAGAIELPLTFVGGSAWLATWTDLPCGSGLQYRWRAANTNGVIVQDPPTQSPPYTALVGLSFEVEILDSLEAVSGWVSGVSTDTATTGHWERVDPNGTAAQPESDQSAVGTQCWVTGQGSVGGALGENDVDGGAVTLLSPTYDLGNFLNPFIGYWRWFSNNAGAGPSEDLLLVQISDDGSRWHDVETVGPVGLEASGGWFFHSFRVADFVSTAGLVRVRFVVSDLATASIVEAAIDDFSIADVSCGASLGPDFRRDDCNGDGSYNLIDAVVLLNGLFLSQPLLCFDRCDANDNGALDLTDALWYLNDLFGDGPAPLPPVGSCAGDPTADDGLDCADSSCP